MNQKYNYIAVEGPIGSGKTTLAKKLASHYNRKLFLEKPEENPFLNHFYSDKKNFSFKTQMFFLLQRSRQFSEIKVSLNSEKQIISDFIFQKDSIFAKLNLEKDDLSLYGEFYKLLSLNIKNPDLLILLQADVKNLLKRISLRGNIFEKKISKFYLVNLIKEYKNFFHNYEASPVLIVNCDNLNFFQKENHFELLINSINNMSGPREYFGYV